MDKIIVKKVGTEYLLRYSFIPIHYFAENLYFVEENKNLDFGTLQIGSIAKPYFRYADDKSKNPYTLSDRFSLDNWQIFIAEYQGKVVGGAILAMNTPEVYMLEGRTDLAVLWDLRVASNYWGQGIGTQLINYCIAEAKSRKCVELKIESQNTNIRACKFYNKIGARLSEYNSVGYDGYENEAQFIWRLALNEDKEK